MGAVCPLAAARELTLAEAVTRTLAQNPLLRETARQSDLAGLEEARYLSLQDPQFSAHYDYAKDRTPPEMPFFGDRTVQTEWGAGVTQNWVTSTQFSAQWLSRKTDSNAALRPINPAISSGVTLAIRQALLKDAWGRPDRAIRGRARASWSAAQSDLRRLTDALAAQAAREYWGLRTAQRLLAMEQLALADTRRLLAKQQEKRRYGTALESDVLQAEAAVAVRESEVILAENRSRSQQALLLETMGELDAAAEEPAWVAVSSPAAGGPSLALAEALGRAETQRDDIVASRSRIEAAAFAESSARLQVLPRLDVTAGLGWTGLDTVQRQSWNDTFSGDHPVVRTGLELSVPLGFRRAKIDRQEASLRLAAERAGLDRLQQRVRREVRHAWERRRSAQAAYDAFLRVARAQNAKLAEESRELARGRSSTDQLIRFQDDLRTAERRLAAAEEELAVSEADLRLAMGERPVDGDRP